MIKIHKLINEALLEFFEKNDKLLFIGEDVLDPYGGAFKISKGLSSKFPHRVIPTPISEQTIIGLSTGLALQGFLPIAEIMFGDFMTIIFDQIYNHLTKFHGMYNGKINPTVLIRTPMGGYRGYGPTHSQSLEKFFIGIPNLKVFALTHLGPVKEFYDKIINKVTGPKLLIENKTLYSLPNKILKGSKIDEFYTDIYWHNNESYFLKMKLNKSPGDYTIITYGGLVPMVLDVVYDIFIEEEINGEVIVLTSLNDFDIDYLIDSLKSTRKFVFVEEGFPKATIGEYIFSTLLKNYYNILNDSPLFISAVGEIIPASKEKENEVLPTRKRIFNQLVEFLGD